MGHKFFAVELSDISLISLPAMGAQFKQLNRESEYYLHFDLSNFKHIYTKPKQEPWCWMDRVYPVSYNTTFTHLFELKYLGITCKKKKLLSPDTVIAAGAIDMHTLMTGATRYEIPLSHPTHKYNIAIVQFTLTMRQRCDDLELRLTNVDVTDVYNRLLPLLHNNMPISISCGYFDPEHTNWELEHFRLRLIKRPSTNSRRRNEVGENQQIMAKRFTVKVDEEVISTDFIRGTLFLSIWTKKNVELGRVIFPLYGNYSTHRSSAIPLKGRILWNPSTLSALLKREEHLYELDDQVTASLQVFNGPLFLQLQDGLFGSGMLIGKHFIGFPWPEHVKETEFKVDTVSIPEFVQSHCLYLDALHYCGYKDLPEWLFVQRMNPIFAERSSNSRVMSATKNITQYNLDYEHDDDDAAAVEFSITKLGESRIRTLNRAFRAERDEPMILETAVETTTTNADQIVTNMSQLVNQYQTRQNELVQETTLIQQAYLDNPTSTVKELFILALTEQRKLHELDKWRTERELERQMDQFYSATQVKYNAHCPL